MQCLSVCEMALGIFTVSAEFAPFQTLLASAACYLNYSPTDCQDTLLSVVPLATILLSAHKFAARDTLSVYFWQTEIQHFKLESDQRDGQMFLLHGGWYLFGQH